MKLSTIFAIFCAISVRAEQPTVTDAGLARQLQGTWIGGPENMPSIRSTTTYNADGTSEEVIRIGKEPDIKIVKITSRWSVDNGMLSLESIASSDPQMVPVGIKVKSTISSISESRLVVVAFEGYGSGSKGRKAIFIRKKSISDQAGTGAPATRPESKSEGSEKSQSGAEGRSR